MATYVVKNARPCGPVWVQGQILASRRATGRPRSELRLTARQYNSTGVQKMLRRGLIYLDRIENPETPTPPIVVEAAPEIVEESVPVVEETPVPEASAEVEEAEPDVETTDEKPPSYEDLTSTDLRALCKSRGLPSYGTKDKLIERLTKGDTHGAEDPTA